MLQVVIGGDAAVRERLDGAVVLEGQQKPSVKPQTPAGEKLHSNTPL